eukprot:2406661-Rhodomonas_salina.2
MRSIKGSACNAVENERMLTPRPASVKKSVAPRRDLLRLEDPTIPNTARKSGIPAAMEQYNATPWSVFLVSDRSVSQPQLSSSGQKRGSSVAKSVAKSPTTRIPAGRACTESEADIT